MRVTALTSSHTFVEVIQGITTAPVERKILLGYQESEEGDSSLSVILDSLIPYLRDNSDPTPLPTFFGNRVVDPTSFKGDLGEVSLPEAKPTKEYAWSCGLEIEYSLVKMRSSGKNLQPFVTPSSVVDPSTSNSGELRVVKALSREK